MTACQHTNHEPVELSTGEVVGRVCTGCLLSLPSTYTGEVHAIHTAASTEAIAYIPQP